MLTEGLMQMPAFHLSFDDRKAVEAFLTAINATGQGLPTHNDTHDTQIEPNKLFENLVNRTFQHQPRSKEASTGRDIVFSRGCINCHLPNDKTLRASDLTQVTKTFKKDDVLRVLTDGVPGKIPAFKLSDKERNAVYSFLSLLHQNAAKIRKGFQATRVNHSSANISIPWFEYK